jgi:pyruvate/2-oxoglutarate dehydrogenase complex dihydrolipoamide acyltransferase (E2) component
MTIIEKMVETRPKTTDKALEVLGGAGLLPAKLLADRIKVTPKKESRFASVEAEVFAQEQRIAIPEGFVGSGKVDGKITIVDLRGLLTGKAAPKEPKAAKAPKAPKAAKEPKAAKSETDARVTKKVRDLLHEWGLDEAALVGITPTAYKGAKFGVGDIAHLEPGLATGGKAKKAAGGKGKASSSASAPSVSSAPSESSDSDSDSDSTEEQDDDFDPFQPA